ncbi:MAG: hypothetical protein A3B86_01120 [Candidatus Yanofskybacteria bacterium RIFCSPHIGHO2_02_FULL_38_22b]|uniref:Uridylate kinase n=1 Tax=Candidatus Yanofskybacteria bacterium RIFCSPHIGHO2_02_FULL_38_22b TaxID=1802673 RepID=A0A1F8F3U8_9BACT|nr:MAG: hypothetical protein A3B86_01120 [Candidatus Yanofskybacteria bacterium RIFCSPHIGHO2_02_FULL_38_22b]OGN20393.1 MAG: hypothetical protein A2910_01470 [Candidatus Yanofskybacteria bacterium RIFCSPLOWO2_01_FULL_39_28]
MDKQRVLLKISGESLGGSSLTYNRDGMAFIGEEIVSVSHTHELAIVVGGGNIIRGATLKKDLFQRDTVVADWIGMQATIMNALALQEFLEKDYGLDTRVLSALEVNKVCEPYVVRRALSHLRKGRIVILAGGIGAPNFSTDTTMVQRASELETPLVLKGTKVDGVYNKDPKSNIDAEFLPEISYMDYLNKKLKIVDATAVTQAMNHGIEIRIFNFFIQGNLRRILTQKDIGSVIH